MQQITNFGPSFWPCGLGFPYVIWRPTKKKQECSNLNINKFEPPFWPWGLSQSVSWQMACYLLSMAHFFYDKLATTRWRVWSIYQTRHFQHFQKSHSITPRWRVWSIYQTRHWQKSQKWHSMACLINLLNNGVNGVDGVDGFNGVFDNLPDFDLQVNSSFCSPFSTLRFSLKIK